MTGWIVASVLFGLWVLFLLRLMGMTAVMQFYANPDAYRGRLRGGALVSDVQQDRGRRARAILGIDETVRPVADDGDDEEEVIRW